VRHSFEIYFWMRMKEMAGKAEVKGLDRGGARARPIWDAGLIRAGMGENESFLIRVLRLLCVSLRKRQGAGRLQRVLPPRLLCRSKTRYSIAISQVSKRSKEEICIESEY